MLTMELAQAYIQERGERVYNKAKYGFPVVVLVYPKGKPRWRWWRPWGSKPVATIGGGNVVEAATLASDLYPS